MKIQTPSPLEQWKALYERERPNLRPNAISGEELAAFVQSEYDAVWVEDEAYAKTVTDAVKGSALFSEKLNGEAPKVRVFWLADGSLCGVDLVSGMFLGENETVRDALTYKKGLDEADLDNVIRTADWLRCKNLAEQADEKQSCITFVKKESETTAFDALREASHTAGVYAAYLRGDRCSTARRFFREISAAMQFPKGFGENWDALSECLTDLDWLSFQAVTVVIDDYDKLFGTRKRGRQDRETLCAVFETSAAFWAKLGVPFRVIAVCGE